MKHNGSRARHRVRALPKKTVVIEFEDGDYAGARVVCSGDISVALYLQLNRDLDGVDDKERIGGGIELLRRFGREILLEWNFDDPDGHPLPPTEEGMLALPMGLSTEIMIRWNQAYGVPVPLGDESNSGDTSPEESTMLETSSASLLS